MIFDNLKELDENLRAALASATGRPVGLVEAPIANNAAPSYPYAILYPIIGGTMSGSWQFPEEDAVIPYQVTSVGQADDPGKASAQARWLGQRVRSFFVGREADGSFSAAIDPGAGWTVNYRSVQTPGGVERMEKSLYQMVEIYALSVTKDSV